MNIILIVISFQQEKRIMRMFVDIKWWLKMNSQLLSWKNKKMSTQFINWLIQLCTRVSYNIDYSLLVTSRIQENHLYLCVTRLFQKQLLIDHFSILESERRRKIIIHMFILVETDTAIGSSLSDSYESQYFHIYFY